MKNRTRGRFGRGYVVIGAEPVGTDPGNPWGQNPWGQTPTRMQFFRSITLVS